MAASCDDWFRNQCKNSNTTPTDQNQGVVMSAAQNSNYDTNSDVTPTYMKQPATKSQFHNFLLSLNDL